MAMSLQIKWHDSATVKKVTKNRVSCFPNAERKPATCTRVKLIAGRCEPEIFGVTWFVGVPAKMFTRGTKSSSIFCVLKRTSTTTAMTQGNESDVLRTFCGAERCLLKTIFCHEPDHKQRQDWLIFICVCSSK